MIEHVRLGRNRGVELGPDAGGPPTSPRDGLDDAKAVAVELAHERRVTPQRRGLAAVQIDDGVIVRAGRGRFVGAANVARQFDFAPNSGVRIHNAMLIGGPAAV